MTSKREILRKEVISLYWETENKVFEGKLFHSQLKEFTDKILDCIDKYVE